MKSTMICGNNVLQLPCCDVCGNPQKTYGAILISPPTKRSYCKKTHVCINCFALWKTKEGILKEILSNLKGESGHDACHSVTEDMVTRMETKLYALQKKYDRLKKRMKKI